MAFARGAVRYSKEAGIDLKVKHVPITNYLSDGIPDDYTPGIDSFACLGVLRGTGQMLKEARAKGFDTYYMDHAYFNPGYQGKGWMRVTKNGHSNTILRTVPKDRWKGHFKKSNIVYPWKTNSERGNKILVLPPTHAVSWFMDLNYSWEEDVVAQLKSILPENEWSRITVRRKPSEPIVDKMGNLIRTQKNQVQGNLQDDLADAHCVIAYNSMVALEATMMGIPVITDTCSPCTRVSFSIQDFKTGVQPDCFNHEPENRIPLLYWLACNQWKRAELEDGTAWRMLQENNHGI